MVINALVGNEDLTGIIFLRITLKALNIFDYHAISWPTQALSVLLGI